MVCVPCGGHTRNKSPDRSIPVPCEAEQFTGGSGGVLERVVCAVNKVPIELFPRPEIWGPSGFESETVSVVMLPRLHNGRRPIVLRDRYEIANRKNIETRMILRTTVVA